jgi:hypothetical protein
LEDATFGLGHTARTDAVNAIDIEVLPDGQGLPPGSGAADAGRAVYVAHCSACHGPTGTEGPNDVLVGGQGSRLANLAACHACVLLPETSCETINEGLDRAMVVGTPDERSHGFMNDLLDHAYALD